MLYYDRIDVSERIHFNKTRVSKECDICHYWYFWNKRFGFQPNVCNGCHKLLMMSMNIKSADYGLLLVDLAKVRP